MKSKNNNKEMLMTSVVFLLFFVGVVICFIMMGKVSDMLLSAAPWATVLLITLLCHIYTVMTVRNLYKFYEMAAPWTAYIPCYGELTLMDKKFYMVGTALYGLIIVFGIGSFLPLYKLNSALADIPFYMLMSVLVFVVLLQLVKGLGIIDQARCVFREYSDIRKDNTGAARHLIWFGFLPFVRIIALRSINQPLSSMVNFMHVTAQDAEEDDSEFVEE